MTRSAFAPATAAFCLLAFASPSFAQAKPATPTATAPAAPAKWVVPLKGIAHIQVIQGQSKSVGTDIVTVLKVKNMSDGAIALLRVDEVWYDKALKQVTGDSESVKRPIGPGEVVDITMKSPARGDVYRSSYAFSHANGKVDAKAVKKFDAK
jgi:hypothetical protein